MLVVDHDLREPRPARVDEHERQLLGAQRGHLVLEDGQREDEQAVEAVAAGEVAEGVRALRDRLDVEEQEVVAAPGERLDRPRAGARRPTAS